MPLPFFQEVLDALAQNNHDHLVLLAELCRAVEAGNALNGSDAARRLARLTPTDRPLEDISSALYYELIARILKLGWFDEFTRLMNWYKPVPNFGETREELLVSNWQGVLTHVPEPQPGLDAGDLIRAWKAEINCLTRAFSDLAKLDVPTPPVVMGEPELTRGFGTVNPLPTLEEQLQTAVEHFFRNTHMLFQFLLDKAVSQLERDRTTVLLRVLKRLHEDRAKLLEEQRKLDGQKSVRAVLMRIRVTEIQDGSPPRRPHLYLDAFPPYKSRRIPISSFDRDEVGPLENKPGLLGDTHTMRDKQLTYYFEAYGEPADAKNTLTPALKRRQDLIKAKHGGRLRLQSNDNLIAFMTNLFEDTVRDLRSSGKATSFNDASEIAWVTVLKFLSGYLDHMTAPTSLDITEEPPNYLTIEFPRSLTGGVLHECGVYAVRLAYVLLSMARNVDRIFPRPFDMRAQWILLPLHVGLILESRALALLVTHNQSLFVFPKDELDKREEEWLSNVPSDDSDPADPGALRRKFIQDVAATAFNNDVDMPLMTFDVLKPKTPVTTKAIWYSYRKHVVPNYARLFSALITLRRAKQYQFDLNFLEIMRIQKRWFNGFVVPFWNVECQKIFVDREQRLTSNLVASKDEYVAALEAAIGRLQAVYDKEVLPLKLDLSVAFRADRKLLPKGVRAVFAERQLESARDVAPVTRVKEHIDQVKLPGFSFIDPATKTVVKPPFARPEEALVKIPE